MSSQESRDITINSDNNYNQVQVEQFYSPMLKRNNMKHVQKKKGLQINLIKQQQDNEESSQQERKNWYKQDLNEYQKNLREKSQVLFEGEINHLFNALNQKIFGLNEKMQNFKNQSVENLVQISQNVIDDLVYEIKVLREQVDWCMIEKRKKIQKSQKKLQKKNEDEFYQEKSESDEQLDQTNPVQITKVLKCLEKYRKECNSLFKSLQEQIKENQEYRLQVQQILGDKGDLLKELNEFKRIKEKKQFLEKEKKNEKQQQKFKITFNKQKINQELKLQIKSYIEEIQLNMDVKFSQPKVWKFWEKLKRKIEQNEKEIQQIKSELKDFDSNVFQQIKQKEFNFRDFFQEIENCLQDFEVVKGFQTPIIKQQGSHTQNCQEIGLFSHQKEKSCFQINQFNNQQQSPSQKYNKNASLKEQFEQKKQMKIYQHIFLSSLELAKKEACIDEEINQSNIKFINSDQRINLMKRVLENKQIQLLFYHFIFPQCNQTPFSNLSIKNPISQQLKTEIPFIKTPQKFTQIKQSEKNLTPQEKRYQEKKKHYSFFYQKTEDLINNQI